jgi:hypothetical protein
MLKFCETLLLCVSFVPVTYANIFHTLFHFQLRVNILCVYNIEHPWNPSFSETLKSSKCNHNKADGRLSLALEASVNLVLFSYIMT